MNSVGDDHLNWRTGFDSVAALYDASRPTYPAELFDVLIETAGLKKGAKLFEIGPGTGQATISLASRGYDITAIELGPALARLAKNNLERYAGVRILEGAFEDARLPAHSFDLVYGAAALHWVRPEYRFRKPHALLKEGGHLAVIYSHGVSDENGDEFFAATQPIYERYKPGGTYDVGFRLKKVAELQPDDFDKNLFHPVLFRVFPMAVHYSAKEYIRLMETFSPVLAMEPDRRKEFLEEIRACIEEKFGGMVRKQYGMTLNIARKK
ncbi:MAG: methyltransferase domain-containing protein [Patescibacteria group bacterium]|nr:methyltransferase domain-containing protein [Patescibacteria group bacterium]